MAACARWRCRAQRCTSGGNLTSVGGQARDNLAAIERQDWRRGCLGSERSLAVWAGYARWRCRARRCTRAGRSARWVARSHNLAAFDARNGAVTAWNPPVLGDVLVLAVSGSTVYVGGNLTSVGGQRDNLVTSGVIGGRSLAVV